MSGEDWRDQYGRRVQELISTHGWMVQGVLAATPWHYTVGLTEAGLPELVVVAMTDPLAARVLNTAARVHLANELMPGVGEVDLGMTVRFRVRPISPDVARTWVMSVARVRYPTTLRALQILWPDRNGLWPGNPFTTDPQAFPPADAAPPRA